MTLPRHPGTRTRPAGKPGRGAAYLTAPAVRPAWICRWKIAYTMIIGMMLRVSAAKSVDHSAW
jgi:hypothetical protein